MQGVRELSLLAHEVALYGSIIITMASAMAAIGPRSEIISHSLIIILSQGRTSLNGAANHRKILRVLYK